MLPGNLAGSMLRVVSRVWRISYVAYVSMGEKIFSGESKRYFLALFWSIIFARRFERGEACCKFFQSF